MNDLEKGQAHLKSVVDLIGIANPRHAKKIRENVKEDDAEYLERFGAFMVRYEGFLSKQNRGLSYVVDCYLKMIEDMIYEQVQFVRTGVYSCKSFEDANAKVYNNPDVMVYYMHGLLMSQFLWRHHYDILLYFNEQLKSNCSTSQSYLEIGGGHGLYTNEAVNILSDSTQVDLLDISQSSIDLAKTFISSEKVEYICIDIFDYQTDKKYDLITIGEVLEHLENPGKMLRRLGDLLSKSGKVFLTIPINSPAVDHIYLFNTMKEIEDFIADNEFEIVSKEYFISEQKYSLAKAEKFKVPAMFAGLIQLKK